MDVKTQNTNIKYENLPTMEGKINMELSDHYEKMPENFTNLVSKLHPKLQSLMEIYDKLQK